MTTTTPEIALETPFRRIALSAICIVGALAYANTLGGEFVWDDASSIQLHRNVQDPAQFLQLFREDQHAFGRGQGNFYRPLLSASFMLDFLLANGGPHRPEPWALPDVNPFLFHVSSTAWHIGAAVFLFLLMTRLGAPRPVRFTVPILYVLHPLHTEAVAYISGRADSMSALLMFAGLCFATVHETPRRRAAGIVLSLLAFAAALLSKESSLIFPVLLLLCILARPEPEESDAKAHPVLRFAPFIGSLVILVLYLAARSTVLRFAAGGGASAPPLGERIVEVLQSFALYMGLLLAPLGLHMERSLDGASGTTTVLGLVLLGGCLGVLSYSIWRKERRAALGMGWFLAAWLPISGLFPLNAPMAEHWMYVPMAGLIWAGAELLYPRLRHPAVAGVAAVAAFAWGAWFLALTVERNMDWHDNATLYTATLRENPNSLRVRYNLAVTYQDLLENDAGARREFEGFLARYDAIRQDNPGAVNVYREISVEARLSLGSLYFKERVLGKAIQHYSGALEESSREDLAPYIGEAAFGLGRCFLAAGDREKAIQEFGRALRIRPDLKAAIQRLMTGDPFAENV